MNHSEANYIANVSRLESGLIFLANGILVSSRLYSNEVHMHPAHASDLTPGQAVLAVIVLFCVLAFYFLPTIMALKKNSPHKVAVIILNIFFGVTVFGWIVALVLASKQPQQVVVVYNMPPPPPPR